MTIIIMCWRDDLHDKMGILGIEYIDLGTMRVCPVTTLRAGWHSEKRTLLKRN